MHGYTEMRRRGAAGAAGTSLPSGAPPAHPPATRPARRPAPRRALAALPAVFLWFVGCGGDLPLPDGDAAPQVQDRAAIEIVETSRAAGSEAAVAEPNRQVVLVTGSTDGLGRELALRLGAAGAHVIVHGRNAERGREVVQEIRAGGGGTARFIAADLGSFDEVRRLARTILDEYDRLDLLVNNAGVGPGAPGHERALTSDGHELRFQVNYLSGFLLTRMLLPLLQESAPSRIVNVTSRNQAAIDFDDLSLEQGYSGGQAYSRSKLAQILFTFDLADALEGAGVTAVAVHPAPAMDTNLVRQTGGQPRSTIDDGAESVMLAITMAAPPEGEYLHETEPARAHEQAYDAEARERLRRVSEELTEAPPVQPAASPARPR